MNSELLNTTSLSQTYIRYKDRKRLVLVVLIPVALILILASIAIGSADISVMDVYATIWQKFFLGSNSTPPYTQIIIWELRLPRVLMGLLSGIAFGCSGAVLQVVLRNPLADPYILGISSAAGFGAALAIIFGLGILPGNYLIVGNAFIFSLISSAIILGLTGRKNASPQTMILTGLALLFFFQAMTTILQYFGESDAVKTAIFWSVGDLGKANWEKLAITAPLIIVGTGFLCWKSQDLNILNAGDATAKSLGVNLNRTRVTTMIICTLMVAGIVSFTGTIGFIGLVAPHLVRMLIGNDNVILVPSSGLFGAVLLIMSDTIARTILSPVVLPVGSVTAFLGVPLFIFLIIKKSGTMR
jgi:iron complex transport system permease protein